MANEKFSQLPGVANATVNDIICAIQGGVSSQETLQQVINLGLSQTVLNYAGNPNGHVAGQTYQLCWDTSDSVIYVCTATGSAVTATWTQAANVAGVVSPSLGGTGVASPTAHALPVAEGSSNFTFKTLTNGQLLIGSTGADPVTATITGSAGISVSNGAGSITISGSGSDLGWTNVTGTTQAMTAESGYYAANSGLVTFTLPTSAAFGSGLAVGGIGSGGWIITQNSGQNIIVGSVSSTTGVGGSVSSTNRYDSIYLVCAVANTTWTVIGAPQGNLTIV